MSVLSQAQGGIHSADMFFFSSATFHKGFIHGCAIYVCVYITRGWLFLVSCSSVSHPALSLCEKKNSNFIYQVESSHNKENTEVGGSL